MSRLKSFCGNIQKTNRGIAYFTNRRDHFIKKSRELTAFPDTCAIYKQKALDMDACIQRVMLGKEQLMEAQN